MNFSARETCNIRGLLHLQVVSVGFLFSWLKVALSFLPSSLSAWQLPRQFSIVLRFGWKERALVERLSGCLIGQGSGLMRLRFGASGGQVGSYRVVYFRKLVISSSSFSSKSCVCGKT
ncbi:hypothetical protein XE88_u0041 [Vibrio parahaemolyticus]|nr:hypothetical protein XE88_u0041 [Vibrio parahaemolyticus]